MANKELRMRLPEEIHDDIQKIAYMYLYQNYKDYKPVYEIMRDNPGVPLKDLQYRLRATGWAPNLAKMREIAFWCDLSWTE